MPMRRSPAARPVIATVVAAPRLVVSMRASWLALVRPTSGTAWAPAAAKARVAASAARRGQVISFAPADWFGRVRRWRAPALLRSRAANGWTGPTFAGAIAG